MPYQPTHKFAKTTATYALSEADCRDVTYSRMHSSMAALASSQHTGKMRTTHRQPILAQITAPMRAGKPATNGSSECVSNRSHHWSILHTKHMSTTESPSIKASVGKHLHCYACQRCCPLRKQRCVPNSSPHWSWNAWAAAVAIPMACSIAVAASAITTIGPLAVSMPPSSHESHDVT